MCNFFRARARNKNRKCKLAANSVRFVAAVSQRFRTCSKLKQLGGDFWEIAGNIALESQGNRSKIAASLHLR